MPLLSIITPNRNHLEGLRFACECLPRQTLQDWEHLVIDSASTDGSAEFALARDKTRVLSEKDDSIEEALHKGLALTAGKYVTFLLCWDRIVPASWLEKGVRFLEENPEYSMVSATLCRSGGKAYNYHLYPSGEKSTYYFFIAPWTPLNETAFICRRSVLQKCFPPYKEKRADSDIFLQLWINFFEEGYLSHVFAEDVLETSSHNTSRIIAELSSGEWRRKEHDFLDKKRIIRKALLYGKRTILFKSADDSPLRRPFSRARFILATLLYKISAFWLRKVLRRKISKFQYDYAPDLARKCIDLILPADP
ncbi:MAG TPA: glycosyltransferase [Candidatus Methylacidiphilales bacterium]|nr:glycosyltransferase [Candidatus Methylacidiphilales bacterium]